MFKLSESRYYNISELAAETGISKGTVRYYLREVLQGYFKQQSDEIKVKPGQAKLYSPEVLDRLKFIKFAKEELKTKSGNKISPSIDELTYWMVNITDNQVREVLNGSEELEFGINKVIGGTRIIETVEGERLPSDTGKYGEQISGYKQAVAADSASNYLDEVLSDQVHDEPIMYSMAPKPPALWKTIRLGPDLEIRHRMNLTKSQKKQLKLTGDLLRSMLSKEK